MKFTYYLLLYLIIVTIILTTSVDFYFRLLPLSFGESLRPQLDSMTAIHMARWLKSSLPDRVVAKDHPTTLFRWLNMVYPDVSDHRTGVRS